MKKSFYSLILSALLLVSALFLLSSCGESDGYDITFLVDGAKTVVRVNAGETPAFTGEPNKASDSQFRYVFEGWDKEIVPATENTTYTANFRAVSLIEYSITFSVNGVNTVVPVASGETPVYPDGTPKKEPTRLLQYVFDGWDTEITPADGNKTYTAAFREETRQYRITFSVNGVETVLTVNVGETPVFTGSTEKTGNDPDLLYLFTGWSQKPSAAFEDITYTAQYEERARYSAALTAAKGGATSVVSMTFDDGIYDTALFLNTMFAKYNLTGSCMMIIGNNVARTYVENNTNAMKWQTLFANGYLEPQNHSMTHIVMPSESWAANNAASLYNNTPYRYTFELLDSQKLLKQYFPTYDFITFAPSNNTLSTYSYACDENGTLSTDASGNYIRVDDGGAIAVARKTFYAIRQGSRGAQSLDPTFGTNAGSWHNLYMRGMGDAKYDVATIKGWIDSTVSSGGWLVSMCHGITETGGDMTKAVAEEVFAYISSYVESGDIWCTTFSEATKYIRERQNSTVSSVMRDGVLQVSLTIDRDTEDGLYLTESVFDTALTVKISVPDDWEAVSFGESTSAVFEEDGMHYAYVEIVPGADGATVTLTVSQAQK